jgi:hypothetical protein
MSEIGIGVLAVLSVSAAGGLRIALPLLILGLTQTDRWNQVPLINHLDPTLVIIVLSVWSLLEIVLSKPLWGQRLLQVVEIIFSPVVGAIMAMGVASILKLDPEQYQIWLLGAIGGILSTIVQLVKIGWFYRLRGIPTAIVLFQDILSVLLTLFALKAPRSGGLIALLLLWLAIRSSGSWYRWYRKVPVAPLDARADSSAQEQSHHE